MTTETGSLLFWMVVLGLGLICCLLIIGMIWLWQGRSKAQRQARAVEIQFRHQADQLCQAQKMEAVGILAGSVSHNFNNLLSIIIGQSELIMDDVPKNSETHRDLQRVVDASHMASDLIKELSTFYSQADQQRRPVRLQSAVHDVLKLLRDILPATVQVDEHIDPECGPVLANSTQVQHVLMNLCSNAYRTMQRQSGVIEVGLQEVQVEETIRAVPAELGPGSYVKLTVQDDGHGLDQATLERIFEPYFASGSNDTAQKLGLNTVYRILERHGSVTIPHSVPGQGTRFDIYFPLIAWSVEDEEDEVAVLPSHHGKGNVLFVDDEPMVARVGKAGLEKLGYRVTAHTDAREALDAFQAAPDSFDVVITDQIMRHMSGIRLARELLTIRPKLPIILATGFRESFNEEQARELGIREFVVKPLSHFELARVIEGVLLRKMIQEA